MSLGSALLMNSHELRLVKSTRESGAASGTVEERVEQLRIANWRQITNASYLTDTFYATQSKAVAPLDNVREHITVTAWPDPLACQPLEVTKAKNSAAQVISVGTGLTDQKLAKVDVTITWKTGGGRERTRELSTIISNGGISRMNLPAMGGASGGTEESTPASQPAADPSPSPGGTPAPVVTETTPTPVVPGNSRGSVGGKAGKK